MSIKIGIDLNNKVTNYPGSPTNMQPRGFLNGSDLVIGGSTPAAATLTITTSSMVNGEDDVAYSVTLAATGGFTPYSWSTVSGSLPTGLTLNSSTGEISGTPTVVNTFNFTVRVTDAYSLTDDQALSIEIESGVTAPVIATVQGDLPASWDVLEAVGFDFTATGGTGDFSWTVTAGTLPTALSIDNTGGDPEDGHLHGTATDDPDDYVVTIRCTDDVSGLYDEETYTLTITPGDTPSASKTAEYISSAAGDFSLTGSSVNVWSDHGGNTDLAITYTSDTKAVRTTTHPINSTGVTVDTNNAGCLYNTPVGGTLADFWPSGVGSIYLVIYVDSHPDSFSAPDHIITFGNDLKIQVRDGPNFYVATNSSTQAVSQSITLDAWHLISIRSTTGLNSLKVQIDDGTEQTATGAAVVTLTQRMQTWYQTGDAGRFDGALAHVVFYSAVHNDTARDQVKTLLRSQYADI